MLDLPLSFPLAVRPSSLCAVCLADQLDPGSFAHVLHQNGILLRAAGKGAEAWKLDTPVRTTRTGQCSVNECGMEACKRVSRLACVFACLLVVIFVPSHHEDPPFSFTREVAVSQIYPERRGLFTLSMHPRTDV